MALPLVPFRLYSDAMLTIMAAVSSVLSFMSGFDGSNKRGSSHDLGNARVSVPLNPTGKNVTTGVASPSDGVDCTDFNASWKHVMAFVVRPLSSWYNPTLFALAASMCHFDGLGELGD
jgi:hypothetical protein